MQFPPTSSSLHRAYGRILVVSEVPSLQEHLAKLATNPAAPETPVMAALLPNGGAILPDGRNEIESLDYAVANTGEQGALFVEMAVKEGQPFAAVIVDWRVFMGRDCSRVVRRMWVAQQDLHIAVHSVFDPESRGQIVQRLGVSHRLLILKQELASVEIARMAQTMAVKWRTERDLSLANAKLGISPPAQTIGGVQGELPSAKVDDRKVHRLETLGKLTDGVAHDFNNFLTVIQGHLSVALADNTDSNKLLVCLDEILKESKKASEATRQLLAFNHRSHLQPCATSVEEALREDIALLRRVLGEEITIEVDHEEDLPPVFADPAALSQVVVSLAARARDSMPGGGKLSINTRRIHIANEMAAGLLHLEARQGDFVVIAFADSGETLTSDELADIFEPFSGSRLMMARELVRQQGGWISCASVPNVGSEFALHLPIANIGEVVQPVPKHVEPEEESKPSLEVSTILVVDDEEAVRQVMEFVLINQGHTVITAKDANEAWTLWCKHSRSINLAIIDIKLPGGVSGFDLERAITEEDCTVPVVFTCGCHPAPLGHNKALKAGVNYLPKPFGMAELLGIVNKAMLQPAKF